MLVQHMPRDSALARAIHGEAADWTATDHLLAYVVDQLAEANWMFATVNRDEDEEPLEYPAPLRRPGITEEIPPLDGSAPKAVPRNPSPAELSQFFAG
ncbi:hypothetical protein GCM10009612_27530 [Streptomyces beijiangensis]